jgi:hypothetical protein
VSRFARVHRASATLESRGLGSKVEPDTKLHPVRMLVGAGRTHTSLLIAGS